LTYILACWEDGVPYGIKCDEDHFSLVQLDSSSRNNRIFAHPYRSGAQKILNWIKENDEKLASKGLSIQDQARFF
jgi:hypothetical protein